MTGATPTTPAESEPMDITAIDLRTVPITAVFESPFNTRKHFNPAAMADLEASIRATGVLTPMIVRPSGDRFELAAGHRRLRAAKSAGVEQVPVRVVPLTDPQLREVIAIENLQREDVHPLDEAEGYSALLHEPTAGARGYTVAIIAAKVGKSESYVYRRLKLLELVPEVKTAFEDERITVAHAERLSRLTPELQEKAFEAAVFLNSPLWDGDEPHGAEDLAPLNELEAFIRENTAFDPRAESTQHFLPEVAAAIAESDESAETSSLLELSEDVFVRTKLGMTPNDKALPLNRNRWLEASSARACPNVQRGVVTHGGKPRLLFVCATKGCPKHFPIEKKTSGGKKATTAAPARNHYQEQEEKWEAEKKEWAAMLPVAGRAFAAHMTGVELNTAMIRILMSSVDIKEVEKVYGVTLTDATAVQVLVLNSITTWNTSQFGADTKPFGWDFKAFEKQWKAEQDAKGKAALKESRAQLKAKGAKKKGAR